MDIQHFTFNVFQTQCYLAWDESGKCMIIDPGCQTPPEYEKITGFIREHGLTPAGIMLTHGHFDHIYGMAELSRAYGIPTYVHEDEMYSVEVANPHICGPFGLPLPDAFPLIKEDGQEAEGCRAVFVKDGDVVTAGSMNFHVIGTPGHSAGGVCYHEREQKVLFSGDTLFAGAIGRSDHPGGDYDKLIRNILEKLTVLDGETAVYPGHGPATDIATEGMTNPFLMPFNEPYED